MKLIFKTSGSYAGNGFIARDAEHESKLLNGIGFGSFKVYEVSDEYEAKNICSELEKEFERAI